jgi:2-aminoadipate transaminase
MRLNFAGSTEEEIREGVRRIGAIMGGETGLFGALTKSQRPRARARETHADPTQPQDQGAPTDGEEQASLADVVELPRGSTRSASKRVRR